MKTKARKPLPRYLSRTLEVSICAIARQARDTTHHRLNVSRASLAEHPLDGLGVAVDDG